MLQTDDLFLGAFGLVRGGELAGIEVRGTNGRRVAVFTIAGPGVEEAVRDYHRGQALVDLRLLKSEVRRLKDVAFEALRAEERRADAGHEGRDRADQVRERARARSSLSEGVELKKKGRQLVASCPFHKEKTASFNVSSAKGLYHCFGCGASGDVIGFVTKHDKVSFGGALETLARRAGLDLERLMEERPADPAADAARSADAAAERQAAPPRSPQPRARPHMARRHAAALLSRVVEHYHRTFCEREDAQAYLVEARASPTRDLLRALEIGYADGSLLKVIPKDGEVREQLVALGVITREGRELLGGCVVVPIPDPLDRPVDEPLRPRAEDAASLLPSRPSSRRRELPGRAARARRSSSPSPSSMRCPSTRSASRSRSRSTARTASRRTTSTS